MLAPFAPQTDGRHGGSRALAASLTTLARRHDVGLLHVLEPNAPHVDDSIREACAFVEPLPLAALRGVRRLQRRAHVDMALLRGIPAWASALTTPRLADRVRSVAASWRPDVLQIEYVGMATYLDALASSGGARVLVDHDALLRPVWEFAHLPRPLGSLYRRLDERAWRLFERRVLGRFDATVVFTRRDLDAVRSVGARKAVEIPLATPIPERPLDPIGRPPPSVVFVGYYGHAPNVDAATWFAQSIFPAVKRTHPDVRAFLVGREPPPGLQAAAGDGVIVTGEVADVGEWLDRAAVVVAPMRRGGGMRVKVLEALAAGKAVVATPLAAEGLDVEPGRTMLIAGSEDEFAAAVSSLLADETRRAEIAAAAYAWARWRAELDVAARYDALYDELVS